MKKVIISSFILLNIFLLNNYSLQGQDSSTKKYVEDQIAPLKRKLDETKQNAITSPSLDSGKNRSETTKASDSTDFSDLGTLQWFLVLLPLFLFIWLFYYFMGWLKKDGYKLSDALSSCDPVPLTTKTITSISPQIGQPAQSSEIVNSSDKLQRSSSRLIAFLTAITATICSLAFLMYFAYAHFAGHGDDLNFDGIWKVLAGLGVGIIPYGFNMWKERGTNN